MIQTQIEIASSPAHVKEVVGTRHILCLEFIDSLSFVQLLDFRRLSEWHSAFVQSISPATSGKTVIEEGDKLNCTVGGFTFTPVVLVRSLLRRLQVSAWIFSLVGS